MFSKFLVCIPLPNKDTLSVADALMQLISMYGCPSTLISDHGSEFISKAMSEVCSTLQIPQQFTPSFTHHCLGACERTHSTLAQRLTPYMDSKSWLQMLPPIVFSINNTVNKSLGYSPHEVVFLQRPCFPLSQNIIGPNLSTLPPDMHHYVQSHYKKLQVIRDEIERNLVDKQAKMVERANQSASRLVIRGCSNYSHLRFATSQTMRSTHHWPKTRCTFAGGPPRGRGCPY